MRIAPSSRRRAAAPTGHPAEGGARRTRQAGEPSIRRADAGNPHADEPGIPHARRRHERSLGQSLVEFALTLPVMLVLTLVALDFGRVYLGYINLQNMSRIAANFAANSPDAWGATPDTKIQAQYRNQILQDASATNCTLPVSGGQPVVPTPQFTDTTGDGMTNTLGDQVTVQITCTFGIITPAISNILGGSVAVSAESNFPIKTGMAAITEIPGVGEPGPEPVAAFIANDTVVSPSPLTVVGPDVAVDFRDTSGGAPIQWEWDFGDGSKATSRDVVHTFKCSNATCEYEVKLKAINLDGDDEAKMKVTVIGKSDVNFTSDRQSGTSPLAVTFTDASTPGGTAYDWVFGDGKTGTGATVSHTYSNAGTYDVTLKVTYPAPVGQVTLKKTGYITVAAGMCTVPSLTGVRFDNAADVWKNAKFTGSVIRAAGAPSGNFIITAQSLTATSLAPCDSSVTVARP